MPCWPRRWPCALPHLRCSSSSPLYTLPYFCLEGADSWVVGIGVDAASVAALGDLDVAVVSAALSPPVLHLEGGAVVADGKDTVIEVGVARWRRHRQSTSGKTSGQPRWQRTLVLSQWQT